MSVRVSVTVCGGLAALDQWILYNTGLVGGSGMTETVSRWRQYLLPAKPKQYYNSEGIIVIEEESSVSHLDEFFDLVFVVCLFFSPSSQLTFFFFEGDSGSPGCQVSGTRELESNNWVKER